jgi:hypothetical protein
MTHRGQALPQTAASPAREGWGSEEKATEALRAYLVEMLVQGKPLPVERKLVDTVVISLT